MLKETKNMASVSDIPFTKSAPLSALLDFSRDYCSDHLGRFFQSNYSLPTKAANKFKIPAHLAISSEQDCFAICVMMDNQIIDLKYFSDILLDWDNAMGAERECIPTEKNLDKINLFINDQRLISVIKSFKKINDEIVIGRCKGFEFTTN
jgi:hypothetical protein